jgi:integrase
MEVEWKAKLHGQMMMGKLEDITFDDLFKNYLTQPLAKNTLRNAESVHKRLGEHTKLSINASDFNQIEFERFVDKCRKAGNKDSSIKATLTTISAVWKAGNKKIYNIPELTLPSVKGGQGRLDYFSEQEETDLLSFLLNRDVKGYGVTRQYEIYDIFVLLLDTGARANEIATLTWEQVDVANHKLDVWRNKTKSGSYLTMTNRVHEVLQRRAKDKAHAKWVFPNKTADGHRTLQTQYLNLMIRKAGIKKTVHHIRHGFAMKMLKAGMTLNDVRVLLGHKNIQTTMKYQHLESSDVSPKAAEILNNKTFERNRSMMKAV